MTAHSGPKALTEYILYQSKHKANKRFVILLMQGILAGMYIAIGAVASLKVSASITAPGLGNFLGALVFPLGIIAIILMQAELFTSDCMVMMAVYSGRTRINRIFGILLLIICSNLLGSIFIAFLTKQSGIFDQAVINLVIDKAVHKVHMPLGKLFTSSVLCNIIVCTGVCLSYSCKDEIPKIAVLWLSIAVFVISGTEHVVANMYYLFAALFYGAELTATDILYNLSVSAAGNFIGGGIIVSGINYLLAFRDIEKVKK
ncbi:MAG TPA: formate/nitrite transporter family protein [Clostridiales bacterium]|nr:formate/nitrite transporter family protein [Clostridiales bacterium]